MEIELPEKLGFLFEPHRYKVAKGGRGSAKSWSFARALLVKGAEQPLRIGCMREVQKSIKDSVHKLLADQIVALNIGWYYDVLDHEIRAKNGGEFLFAGLATHTIESIKSYEGLDVVWVEEGQVVRKRSWEVLIPTIRKPKSEVWVSYNPELETDETHQRFAVNTPPNCVIVDMNYSDNPWFPEELEAERLHALATMPKTEYENIWEGKCKPAVAGAIYYNEVATAEAEGRIRDVPNDPLLKTHAIWDLGWNDSMSIILVQRSASELRIVDYIEGSHRTLSDYAMQLKAMPLNWGLDYLPHDGHSKDFKTGKSAAEILRTMGRNVPNREEVPEMDVEGGIRAARMTFSRMYFDKTKTARLVECLKRYRRSINQKTNEPGAPLHDEYSHGADAFRYMAIVADMLSNSNGPMQPIQYRSKVIA